MNKQNSKQPVVHKGTATSTGGVPSKKSVAVFDIDGTIFRSSLLIKLVEELISRGDFPESARLVYQKYEEAWVDRKGSYEDYIQKVIDTFTGHIKGLPYESLHEASLAVSKRQKDVRYNYTSRLISKLKKEGYYLLAVSQSPWAVLENFCKSLGFDKVYGRFYELGPNERLTGEVRGEGLISDKAAVLRRAVNKYGLTLKGSVGVGDTEGDIPMLSLVENPVCFNPNAKLAKVARSNGWNIVVERKDVIYEWSGKDGATKII
ncbi:MAG: HAD-IB family hydrolase [Candidatus Pacebacteria bacterium]|nr:HAD-IB family hydrolase [Candidatus Paceibacterota bacterium]